MANIELIEIIVRNYRKYSTMAVISKTILQNVGDKYRPYFEEIRDTNKGYGKIVTKIEKLLKDEVK